MKIFEKILNLIFLRMTSAFTEAGRKDIAERVDQIFQDGLERFKSSVKKIRTNDKRFTENF